MELPVNRFKHAIKAGKAQVGIWSSLSSHIVAEILSNSGFDWVLLDTEHSPNELPMVQQQLQAMQGGTANPIVRVAWNDMVMIKRYLDIGAQTLLLPYVQSVEEAKNAVISMRYPQDGMRGVAGGARAAGYGRIKDYHRRAAGELCLLVQVETRKAMASIDEIAAARYRLLPPCSPCWDKSTVCFAVGPLPEKCVHPHESRRACSLCSVV